MTKLEQMHESLKNCIKDLDEGMALTPVVDETWTKADVRRLAQLLVKRAKLIDNLKGALTLEAIADLECACAFNELLRETR